MYFRPLEMSGWFGAIVILNSTAVIIITIASIFYDELDSTHITNIYLFYLFSSQTSHSLICNTVILLVKIVRLLLLVLEIFCPGADRHDRILGDTFAEHSRLLALRQNATRPGHRPGARLAGDDGALLLHRRRGDFGDNDHLRTNDLGPSRCLNALQQSRCACRCDARSLHRNTRHQHRRQRREPGK